MSANVRVPNRPLFANLFETIRDEPGVHRELVQTPEIMARFGGPQITKSLDTMRKALVKCSIVANRFKAERELTVFYNNMTHCADLWDMLFAPVENLYMIRWAVLLVGTIANLRELRMATVDALVATAMVTRLCHQHFLKLVELSPELRLPASQDSLTMTHCYRETQIFCVVSDYYKTRSVSEFHQLGSVLRNNIMYEFYRNVPDETCVYREVLHRLGRPRTIQGLGDCSDVDLIRVFVEMHEHSSFLPSERAQRKAKLQSCRQCRSDEECRGDFLTCSCCQGRDHYCSKSCQKLDWRRHKKTCQPYSA